MLCIQRCNQKLIDDAPDHMKRRLRGLLFQIDMEKRRSKNSTQCCIKLSRLMMDSFVDLQSSITSLKTDKFSGKIVQNDVLDNVIYFPGRKKSAAEKFI